MAFDADEFAEDRQIDPNQLDVEAIKQADLFYKYAEMAVEARYAMDTVKLRMDTTLAQQEAACRDDPDSFGLTRVTEGAIKAAALISKRYTTAAKRYYRARRRAVLLDKAVEAMEQRKRMLTVLITLHGQQYFAGPSVPRNLVEEWTEHQKRAEERVNKRTKPRRRRRKKGDT